ncbi:SCFD1 [Lepeophtheirus salmonis]|uniref:SCFD1 n=1 Tax=Lepeophtheirus salmonis TaxID=72036 RepID=A0A7R8HBD7_LEPSM|nr:SCFD1 [Lepeophtheirus salmonis]CAF2971743.1 SCFD1 [Lepeophtheirus salmonis]
MASPSSSPAMALSLRSRQINTIQSLLKADDWKVLVYDSSGEDIICPLMKVKDLREFGVTLNAHLKDESREFVPDVTALYLVLPSSENIQRIIKDLEKGLYDAYKFFFLTPIPRHRLEEFASGAFAAPNNSIKSVVDQYLNFISLEENMFILGRQKAVKYESPS